MLAKRRVRWLLAILGLLVLAYALFWILFLRGLPSTDKLLSYEPPLPTNVRALEIVPLEALRSQAVDVPDDLSGLGEQPPDQPG